MILTERTITIIDHNSTIDSPIVLYRGDKNVELKLNIKESRFQFRDDDSTNLIETAQASYGQLIIQTPNQNEPIFSEITATKKGYIIFVITAEMIDEIDEVGNYTFQVRLLDSNKRSRATIPPVVNGIEIREPITSEDNNVLNSAVVGLASAANEEVLDTFDEHGDYAKTNWKFGDKITAAKLNKAEDGIYQAYALGLNNSSQIKDIETRDNNIINDATVSSTTTYSSNKIEGIKENLNLQIISIEDEIKNIGNRTAGLTNTAKTLLISILRNAMFNSDQSENITLLADELGVGDSGETTQHTISNSLSNATTSNNAALINANTSYSTTITPNNGYTLSTVRVTMGGTDITNSVYSNGVITISNVTGNIVITAIATASSSGGSTPATYTVTNNLSNCSTNNSNTSVNSGYVYMSTITANSGYTMSSIVVTMGGNNITSTAVSGNSINIPSVTGNVVITASATKNSTGNPTVPTLSYTSTDVPQIINYYYPAKRKVSTSETTIPIYFSDYYQREYYYEDTSLRFNLRVDVDGNVKWINNLPAGDYDVSLGVLSVGEHYFSVEVTQVGVKTVAGNDLRSQRLFNKILIVESMDIPASATYTVTSSDLSNYNITLGLTSSATETQMTNNRNGMTNMFKALHEQGYKKIIMPANSVIRINCVGAETKPSGVGWDRWVSQKAINIPTNTTVDLNGSTIKLHPYDDRQYDNVGAVANFMVVMNDCVDSHLINGTLEGDWEERKASNFYQGSNGLDNYNGEHAGCICIFGGKYNTVDNLTITNITGYSCQNEKSMKDAVFTNMCYHWGPNKGCWLNGNNTDMVNGVATPTTETRLTSDYVDLVDVLPYGEFAPGRLFVGFPVCYYFEALCSFFDANKNFIDSFIAYQARHVRIPNNAKYVRVTLNGKWQDLANDNGYNNNPDFMLVAPYQSEYSEWNNLHFVDNRTCCNPNRFRNLRVYKCDFTRVGHNITPVALDAEDGNSTMQDLYIEECKMIERGEGQQGDMIYIAGLNVVMQNNPNLSFRTGPGVIGLTVRNNTLGAYGSLVKKGWKTRNTYRVYNNISQDNVMMGVEQEAMGDDQDKDALLMIKNCTPMAYTYGANKNDVLMRGLRIKDCDDVQLGDWGHLYNCTCYINSTKVNHANKTGSATFNGCTITRKTSGGNGNTSIIPFGTGMDNMGTYTNCIFNFPGVSSTSFVSGSNGGFVKGEFNNCTFKTAMIFELVNANTMGDIKFNNCKFEANLTLKLTDTKVQFNGCTFNGITYENNGQANTQIN